MLENPPDSGGYDFTQGHYRIRGQPSFSRVKWFCMGVENDSGSLSKKSGEIWADELRVTDVRKNPGWSMTSSISARFADFLDVSLQLNRIDSEFHSLRDNRGSGINSTNKLFRTAINLDKFLPLWWGLKLPFSYSWSKNLDVPRLKSGSDIVLPADQREKEKRESSSETFNFNPSFSRNTKNWMINWTLNRVSTNMSFSRQKSRSPEIPISNSSMYWVSGGYDLTPPSKPSLNPLSWSKKVFLLKKISQTKFYYLPSRLSFSGDLNRRKSFQKNEVGNITSEYIRDFKGIMNLGFAPVSPMSINYTRTTDRDLRNDSNIKFSLNPQKMKLGIERRLAENLRISYNPRIFSFLDHSFSFNSNYSENCDPAQFPDRTRLIVNDNTKSANFTFKWKQLLGKISPSSSKSGDDSNAKKKNKTSTIYWIRKQFGSFTDRIDPISGSISRNKSFNRSGLFGRPSLRYQLGLIDEPGVKMKPTASGAVNDNVTIRDSYNLRSGIRVLKSADINLGYTQAITNARNPTSRTENRSKTFPDLSFSWNNISKFKFLNRYVNSWGFKSGYSKKVDTSKDKLANQPKNRSTSISFSPLASFSFAWKNGIQTSLTIDKGQDKQEDLRTRGGSQEVTVGTDQNIALSNSYSFRAPHGIKLPFLKRVKFESNLSLSLDISHRIRKQKKSIQGKPFNPTQHRTELTITPRAGYSFSSQVQAGLSGSWIDINDKMTKIKSHVREFGIWAEIQF
jgi:cell surface protein SprA